MGVLRQGLGIFEKCLRIDLRWLDSYVSSGVQKGMKLKQIPLADLMPDPQNERSHPEQNISDICASLTEFGQVEPLVIRAGSNILIGGHGRLMAMKVLEWKTASVVEFSGDDVEVAALRIALNSTAESSKWDRVSLRASLESLSGAQITNLGLGKLAKKMRFSFTDKDLLRNIIDSGKTKRDEEEQPDGQIFGLMDDVMFSSSNRWGIPDLWDDGLGDEPPDHVWGIRKFGEGEMPLVIFPSRTIDDAADAVVGFYQDDKKIERIWTKCSQYAEMMKHAGVKAALTPDFSIWRDWPMARQLWQVYRQRYCGRYFQSVGIRVIPSISVGTPDTHEFIIKTLPEKCPIISLQCRTLGDDEIGRAIFIESLQAAIEHCNPDTVLIYGGQEHKLWIQPHIKDYDIDVRFLLSWEPLKKKAGAT